MQAHRVKMKELVLILLMVIDVTVNWVILGQIAKLVSTKATGSSNLILFFQIHNNNIYKANLIFFWDESNKTMVLF